ncbi:unnamed protein product [Parascedosporium putredinis]|uniref:Uncharacterized protein n=1 Tax=Parascedosporium putredinis TaxID=1442378 RepID=A0A9P1H6D8_9PEZI|nr:unnamed protein product [Parascedosporium putredinis]CAI7998586.1 unnamed protein product [Parascedosporium putredinis]
MPLRNYFGRRTGVPLVRDDITQSHDSSILKGSDDHFQPRPLKGSTRQDTGEYKLSAGFTFRTSVPSHQSSPTTFPRQSLDSARFPRLPRSSLPYRDGARPLETEPESDTGSFEDVGLGEPSPYLGAPSRRRGFFGMFSESHEVDPDGLAVSRFLPGRRRRGQSGQGAELGSMERPETSASHDEVQMMV